MDQIKWTKCKRSQLTMCTCGTKFTISKMVMEIKKIMKEMLRYKGGALSSSLFMSSLFLVSPWFSKGANKVEHSPHTKYRPENPLTVHCQSNALNTVCVSWLIASMPKADPDATMLTANERHLAKY